MSAFPLRFTRPFFAAALLFATALLFAAPFPSEGSAPPTAAEETISGDVRSSFTFETVRRRAEELASSPFENPDGSVPDFLLKMSYDQWRKIRFRPAASLWREEGLPFEVQFFHPGLFYNRLVKIHQVEEGRDISVPFSSSFFDYGDGELAARVEKESLDFAGFRVHYPLNRPDYKDEVVVFLGATYFRAVAKGLQYGLSARAVALDTALPSGEEFPFFREFWIEKPAPGASSLRIYGLLDSPSLTGACSFLLIPGRETDLDVECTFYLRKEVQKIGIAPLTSMFLYGETENGSRKDFRPEVHDSDGLLLHTEDGEWIWRPLANLPRLAVLSWAMENPAGFGLLQRDQIFDHYLDLEARYEIRPSLWIEPRGKWGPGRMELVEIPSELEIHDNMVAYWVPEKDESERSREKNAGTFPSGPLSFAYRMAWMAPGENLHSLGRTASTRKSPGPGEGTVRFVLDFEGGELKELSADAGLTSVITLGEGARLLEKQLAKNDVTGGWRLVFTVALDPEGKLTAIFPTSAARPSVRLTALLKKGENLPDPLTETWSYDLHP